MNRKIIVTGGCGYIGSHVARAFKQNGDSVVVIDRERRDHTLADTDGFYHGDFASTEGLATIYTLEPDVIVHCAGTSLVGPSVSDPAEYYHNNIAKTIRMLNVIKNMEKKPVILFSSSASVYGIPGTWPIDESEDIKPISPYGNTKAMTETILNDYSRAYGIHSMCFRYFNAAGAEPFNFDLGQEPGATHIIARALEASIADRAFTINGSDYDTDDGTCVRDYIHVWDLAQAHVLGVSYMLDDYPQPGAYILNLGTNLGISNKEIVDYVVDKYGISSVNYGERRAGDPDILIADAAQAKSLLGWEPKNSNINTIIDSAYRWYTK
jgi:UDP-glucose-4-epimerase GalE